MSFFFFATNLLEIIVSHFLQGGHTLPRDFPVSLFNSPLLDLLFQRSLAATDRYLVN